MPLLTTPTVTEQTRTMPDGTVQTQYLVYAGTQNGRGVKYYRASRVAADALASELTAKVKELGQLATRLTSEQTVDAANALRMLSDAGATLTLAETVRQWLEERGGAAGRECSIGDTVAAYLKTIPTHKTHHATVQRILTNTLWKNKDAPMSAIRRATVESALSGIETPKTYNLTRGYIMAFLNWAQAQKMYSAVLYADCKNISKKRVPYRRPEFISANTAEKVLRWAEAQQDSDRLVPKLALGLFAGIRSAEVYRMSWGDIKFRELEIRVETPKGVDGTPPRIVTMSPNLRAWLIRYQLDDDEAVCHGEEKMDDRMADMRAETGITLPRNALRHTFCTMHIAMWRNAGVTATELGHGANGDVMRRHYQGVTSKEDAERFWGIMPKEAT